VHVQNNGKQFIFKRSASRSCSSKLVAALFAFIPLPIATETVFNCFWRPAFRTGWVHLSSSES
jgi:hypothetical protein